MVTPYLVFSGNCREALQFYKEAFNGSIKSVLPYGDYVPEGAQMPADYLRDWVLHAETEIYGKPFRSGDEISKQQAGSDRIKPTAPVPDAREAQRIYYILSKDAQILLPPDGTFCSAFHAEMTDSFVSCRNIAALEQPQKS